MASDMGLKIVLGVAILGVVVLILVRGGMITNGQDGEERRTGLETAVSDLAAADSFYLDASLNLNLPARTDSRERPFTEVWAQIEGDVKKNNDGREYEFGGNMHLEAKGRGNLLYTDGEIRFLDNMTVFKLEELPALLNPGASLVGKWVKVPGAVAHTNDPVWAHENLKEITGQLEYQGQETVDGREVEIYAGTLSDDIRQKAAKAWQQSQSGNKALGMVARLLRANEIVNVEMMVDVDTGEVARIRADFAHKSGEETRELAKLTLVFRDYGKEVVIERPEAKVDLDPQVFKNLFGSGDLPQ